MSSFSRVRNVLRATRQELRIRFRLLAAAFARTPSFDAGPARAQFEQQAQQLRQWIERVNLATETAGIGMWDWDLATGKLSSDTNMAGIFKDADLTGVASAQDFISKILLPEDRDQFMATMRAAIARDGGNRLSVNFRYLRKDGGMHHVELHGRIVRNAHGRAERFLGISWNITAKVEAQAEIERQSAAQQALLERLNLATEVAGIDVWDWDLATDHFTADANMSSEYASTHIDLQSGRALVAHIVHPDDVTGYLQAIDTAIESGQSLFHRYRMVLPDGTQRHVQAHARVFCNNDGKAVRMLGVSLDITEEIEHRNKLQSQADEERALHDRLNLATKTAGIGIWDKDLISGAFECDDQFWKIFGLAPDRFFKVQNGIHPSERERALTPLNAAFADASRDEILAIRHRTSNPRPEPQYVQTHMRVFRDATGKPVRFLGVTWDVTNEVLHAEQLQRKADQERALVERLNVVTKAARISPWEFDLKTNQFSWHGLRQEVYGLDDVPLSEYSAAFYKIVLEEDRSQLTDPVRKAIENDIENYSYQFRVRGTDGKIHYMRNIAHLQRNARGKFRYIMGITMDVTGEVEAAEQLRSQAELERTLLDRLSVATQAAGISPWEFDLKSNQYIWFGARLAVLGLDNQPVDTYYDALRDILLPEDRNNLHDAVVDAINNNVDVYSTKYRARGTDGQIHYLKNFVRIRRSPRGTPYRLIGVTWDISEEIAANERLEQQVQHAQALKERLGVATLAAGISPFEIDLTTGKFLWVENPIKALSGIRGTDNTLTTFSQRIHPDDTNIFRNEIARAAKGGYDVITYCYRALTADDSVAHIQTYAKLYFNENRRATRALGVSWDASEEVEAAARLEKQAQKERILTERLSIATQSAGISTWEIDLVTNKFLWVENPINVAIRSHDGEELSTFSQRLHPEDTHMFRDAVRAAAKEGRDVIMYRYRFLRQDGSVQHIQTHAKLYFNDARRAVRALGVSWDMSREVESAEKLRDAERRLERASLSSSEGHWEAELATGNLWCSSSFHTLLGYIEGELETRVSAFDQLVHADDRATYHDALRKHLVDKERYDVETRMRMANGEYRWFRMRGMAERDSQDQPTVMAGSIHDVHQQKLVEDALDLAQRRFERAINGTQDGLWELDVATESAWCSPRLALLLGYPTAQLEAHNFLRSLMHPEDADKVAKVTQSHYRHNTPFDLEVRLKTNNDDYRWYRARATAERDGSGRAVRLSGSLQDVTEARAAREELVRATEAAEAASRAKSDFLANVSHEIRTPMNGIIGMTGLLLDTQLDRTQSDYANTIRGSADSLLTIINDILDFSKIEAGKLDLENIELNLRSNVEDVGAMMAFQAANKGLELIINVHPEVPEYVLGDPQRLRQCLINLVGNAIKFTKNGEIVVDVCAIGRHEGRVLTHFEVRDTGMGIPEKTLKTLFQPFVQADSSTTRHFGGTGLGLSIVRRLVEMMGGQVGVVSELGKGSNFFFTLSLEPKEHATPTPLTRNLSSDGRILIVDDNATNRRVLDALLTHQGYRVITAGSGAEALKQLQSSVENGSTSEMTIDMVITDFQMPDMDGLMLGEQIGNHPALANTRLVMLTSLDRQGDTKRLTELGFAAYLTKPVRTRELLDCVARVLSGEARQWQMEIRPMITRNSLSQSNAQQRFHGHVLVVEDNLVNQKVAARFLERLGCTVRIADHGADGVVAMEMEHFDIVFMDLQMPVMDGLTAARKIRELESADPTRRRTPIVALTANAMRGDQERCETAGMDGFLTKPIEVERLRNTLAKFGLAVDGELPNPVGAIQIQPSSAETTLPAPIDLARLREITDGDAEFTRELIETFIVSGEQQLGEIHAAIGSADRDSLARAAHKLKGACANIYANALYTYASHLEAEARTARDEDLQSCHALLQQEFARAKHFLSSPSVVPVPVKAAS